MREAPGAAIGAERNFMKQTHGDRLAAAGLEVEIEDFGPDFSGRGIQRGEQSRTLSSDDVAELERARADLSQIVIEPGRQCRIEVNDVAGGIDRKEPGRRVVEIVDGMLELLEHIFLPLALARNIGDRPHRHARDRVVSRRAGRTRMRSQRATLPGGTGDAYLFLQPASLSRGLEQAVDRLGDVRIADKDPLDRPDIVYAGCTDEIEVSGVGIEHASGMIGHQDAVESAVHHCLEQRVALILAGKLHDAGGRSEEREHADRSEHRQQNQDVGLDIVPAHVDQTAGRGDQHRCNHQHHGDRTAARRILAFVVSLALVRVSRLASALPDHDLP